MKLFKVFLSLFILAGSIFLISLFFPHTYKIERTIVVNKPVYESFAFMNDIRNWDKWSPWNSSIDSTLQFHHSDTAVGLLAREYFDGKLVGKGFFEITESHTNETLGYRLSLNDGNIEAKAHFVFNDINGHTKLTWIDEGDVGYNPLYRFMLSSKTSATEAAFDEGLIAIKKAIEAE